MVFELYSKKLIELFSYNRAKSEIDFKMQNQEFIKYNIKRCRFSEYFVDYGIYGIKKSISLNKSATSVIEKKLKDFGDLFTNDDSKIVKEFTLALFKINNGCLYTNKVKKLSRKIQSLYMKKKTIKFMIMYIFAFIVKNDRPIEFNPKVVRLFEDLITKNIANLFEIHNNDNETLFGILVICYEMFCSQKLNQENCFSPKFLKFFKNFSFWYSSKIWSHFVEFIFSLLANQTDYIYFTNIVKFKKHRKSRIKKSIKVYEFAVFIAFHFLKLPFELLMDIINEINERTHDVGRNDIYDLSKTLESQIEKNYNSVVISKILQQDSELESEHKEKNIFFAFKKTLDYLNAKEDNIFKFLLLSKKMNEKLGYKIYKSYLCVDKLTMQQRLNLWENLTNRKIDLSTNLVPNSIIFALDERSKHVLRMDVKRTNFARMNSDKLEKLLLEIAGHHPSTAYYQGMNCIGGFLLNYSDDYLLSKKVFSFLVKKRLEVYFLNSFSRLKRLLYIAERIIKIKLPALDKHFETLEITTEFYLSPLILTVFSASLQFIDNYNLVAKIFDIFIAKGWPAFFKVFVWVFSRLQKKLLSMNYENILQFLNKDIYEAIFLLDISTFKRDLDSIRINKKNLEVLGKEYDKTRKVVEEYWTNYYERIKNGTEK